MKHFVKVIDICTEGDDSCSLAEQSLSDLVADGWDIKAAVPQGARAMVILQKDAIETSG